MDCRKDNVAQRVAEKTCLLSIDSAVYRSVLLKQVVRRNLRIVRHVVKLHVTLVCQTPDTVGTAFTSPRVPRTQA